MKLRNKFIILSAIAVMLTGCSEKTADDLPEDTPWNNGVNAVMETENGYYTNISRQLNLRYAEKGSDIEIFLCARPECSHNGNESCTATYNKLETTNTVLYDGSLYFVSTENSDETVGYYFYKAASDGTALDKIGDVFNVQNSSDAECNFGNMPFVIHKGFAYIPYYIAIGEGTVNTYAGSGIVKMNIENGEKEQLITGNGYFDYAPEIIGGCGDYVYYNLTSNHSDWNGSYRYNITDGSIEALLFRVYPYKDRLFSLGFVSEDNVTIDKWSILEYDVDTLEPKGEVVSLDENLFGIISQKIAIYDDMFFGYGENRVDIYEFDGNKLGSIDIPEAEDKYRETDFKISDGRLYMIRRLDLITVDEEGNYIDNLFDVYSCEISEITSGTGTWQETYGIKNAGNVFERKEVIFK